MRNVPSTSHSKQLMKLKHAVCLPCVQVAAADVGGKFGVPREGDGSDTHRLLLYKWV